MRRMEFVPKSVQFVVCAVNNVPATLYSNRAPFSLARPQPKKPSALSQLPAFPSVGFKNYVELYLIV